MIPLLEFRTSFINCENNMNSGGGENEEIGRVCLCYWKLQLPMSLYYYFHLDILEDM